MSHLQAECNEIYLVLDKCLLLPAVFGLTGQNIMSIVCYNSGLLLKESGFSVTCFEC